MRPLLIVAASVLTVGLGDAVAAGVVVPARPVIVIPRVVMPPPRVAPPSAKSAPTAAKSETPEAPHVAPAPVTTMYPWWMFWAPHNRAVMKCDKQRDKDCK